MPDAAERPWPRLPLDHSQPGIERSTCPSKMLPLWRKCATASSGKKPAAASVAYTPGECDRGSPRCGHGLRARARGRCSRSGTAPGRSRGRTSSRRMPGGRQRGHGEDRGAKLPRARFKLGQRSHHRASGIANPRSGIVRGPLWSRGIRHLSSAEPVHFEDTRPIERGAHTSPDHRSTAETARASRRRRHCASTAGHITGAALPRAGHRGHGERCGRGIGRRGSSRAIAELPSRTRIVVEEPEVYDLAGVIRGALSDDEVWVIDPLDGTTSFVHVTYPCSVRERRVSCATASR